MAKIYQLYNAIVENNIPQASQLSQYFGLFHVEEALSLKRYELLRQCFPKSDSKPKIPPEVTNYFNSPEHQTDSLEYRDFILNNWDRLQEIGFVLSD